MKRILVLLLVFFISAVLVVALPDEIDLNEYQKQYDNKVADFAQIKFNVKDAGCGQDGGAYTEARAPLTDFIISVAALREKVELLRDELYAADDDDLGDQFDDVASGLGRLQTDAQELRDRDLGFFFMQGGCDWDLVFDSAELVSVDENHMMQIKFTIINDGDNTLPPVAHIQSGTVWDDIDYFIIWEERIPPGGKASRTMTLFNSEQNYNALLSVKLDADDAFLENEEINNYLEQYLIVYPIPNLVPNEVLLNQHDDNIVFEVIIENEGVNRDFYFSAVREDFYSRIEVLHDGEVIKETSFFMSGHQPFDEQNFRRDTYIEFADFPTDIQEIVVRLNVDSRDEIIEDNENDNVKEFNIVLVDTDSDGVADNRDNCPITVNTNQADSDNDGVGDLCDNNNVPAPAPDNNRGQDDNQPDSDVIIDTENELEVRFDWLETLFERYEANPEMEDLVVKLKKLQRDIRDLREDVEDSNYNKKNRLLSKIDVLQGEIRTMLESLGVIVGIEGDDESETITDESVEHWDVVDESLDDYLVVPEKKNTFVYWIVGGILVVGGLFLGNRLLKKQKSSRKKKK